MGSSESVRISRSAAFAALLAVADRWGVPWSDRYRLLAVSAEAARTWFDAFNRGTADEDGPLEYEILVRISHIVTTYDDLHRFYVGHYADCWMHRPNRAFDGRRPLELVLSGRREELLAVRTYVFDMLHH